MADGNEIGGSQEQGMGQQKTEIANHARKTIHNKAEGKQKPVLESHID